MSERRWSGDLRQRRSGGALPDADGVVAWRRRRHARMLARTRSPRNRRQHGFAVRSYPLRGPDPVAQFGRVVAVLAGVGAGAKPFVDHLLAQQRRALAET